MTLITKIISGVVVVLIVLGGSWWFFRPDSTDGPRTITTELRSVIQDVEFTGRLQSVKSADLGFETTGTVAEFLVTEGESVTAGQAIAVLEPSIAELDLASDTARQLSSAEQKQIAFDQAEVAATNTNQTNKETLAKNRQAVRDAKIELDQARNVHNQTDQDSGQSAATETALATLRTKESAYHAAQQALTESTSSIAKSNQDADDDVETAKAAYLATTQASGRDPGFSALEAAREISRLKLGQKTVHAPFDGVITEQYHEIGETVIAGTAVATIQTTQDIELVANVTESDAAKIATNMSATITFDALPQQEQWSANIFYIAAAALISEGVPTYQVKMSIDDAIDTRLKPGLTTNITVHAATRDNVIAIPRRAVATRGTSQFVRLLNDDRSISEVEVTTGLIGTDGFIEIIDGLNADQKVVTATSEL